MKRNWVVSMIIGSVITVASILAALITCLIKAFSSVDDYEIYHKEYY